MSDSLSLRGVLVLLLLACLAHSSTSFAITRSKLCKPAKLCDPIKDVPKRVRKLIDKDQGLVWSTPRIASKEFSIDQNGKSPQYAVPADKRIMHVCDVAGGVLKCYDVVELMGCPKHARFNVTVNGQQSVAECDLVCTPDTPDADGNCDCETTNCVYS